MLIGKMVSVVIRIFLLLAVVVGVRIKLMLVWPPIMLTEVVVAAIYSAGCTFLNISPLLSVF